MVKMSVDSESTSALWLSVASVTITWSTWKWIIRPYFEAKHPIPGLPTPPRCHWLVGHASYMLSCSSFEEMMQRLSYQYANKQGRAAFWLGPMRAITLTNVQDVKTVLHSEYYRRPFVIAKYHMSRFLGEKNIGVLTGKVWKHERSIILKSFSKSSLEQSEKAIIQTTQDLIHAVKTKLSQKSPPDDSTISMNVLHLMKMITMDVFGKVAFSHSFGNCGSLALSPVAEAFDFLGRDLFRRLSSGSMLPWNLFYQWPNEANKQSAAANILLHTFVRQAITDRKSPARSCDGNESMETQESESQNDLLARLMKAHKEAGTEEVNDLKTQMNKKTSSKRNDLDTLTDKVLEDVLISLLFAGYDTTSITLSYALYMLASHDSMYQSCLEEIDRVGVNEDSWENLVLIKAVVKEVLRLFPPGFMTTRTLQKPAKMSDGFVLPPCQVIVSIWAIQRSEENFPHATSFRPDRWASWTGREWKSRSSTDTVQPNDCSNIAAGNEQAFLAFSSGARSCPGQKFAWRELVLVLAGLLKELTFKTIDGYELRSEQFGIVQQPKDGLPMEIGLR